MTVGQVRALAEQAGRRMRAAGVTMVLAPVLDLSDGAGPDAADPDGPRSFSIHGSIATAYGLAFAQGLQDGGVIPVVKHFPGLGQASHNTAFGPASDPPLSVLQAGSLRPFEAAIGAGWPGTLAPQRRRRAAGCVRRENRGRVSAADAGTPACHRAGTGMLRRRPTARARRDRAATRPARPIKAAGRHMARQPGSEGLRAEAVRPAIYNAARQDYAGLSYNQC